jgi:hypothetical protein
MKILDIKSVTREIEYYDRHYGLVHETVDTGLFEITFTAWREELIEAKLEPGANYKLVKYETTKESQKVPSDQNS